MLIVSSSDLCKEYDSLIDSFLRTGNPIFITKNDSMHAVLLTIDDYERISKKLLIMEIDQGVTEVRDGKARPLEESMARIRKEIGI